MTPIRSRILLCSLATLAGMLLGGAYAAGVCIGVHLEGALLPITLFGALLGAPCGLVCGWLLLHLEPVARTLLALLGSAPVAAPLVAVLGCDGAGRGPSLLLLPFLAMVAFTAGIRLLHALLGRVAAWRASSATGSGSTSIRSGRSRASDRGTAGP